MKLIYITNILEDILSGYNEKVYAQSKAFSNFGIETYLYISSTKSVILYKIKDDKLVKIHEKNYKYDFYNKYERILNRITIKRYREFINGIYTVCNLVNPDVIYIRRICPLTNKLINCISYLKEKGKMVIYEYPTFPWEEEMTKDKNYLRYILDKIHYTKLISLIDIITVILGKNQKLPSKFVEITNGIDIRKINSKIITKYDNKINLIGIAHLQYWHGYDRIIKGMKYYYDKKSEDKISVYFHIVGDGAQLANLKKLVDNYNLNNYVIFHGSKIGTELDELVNKCNIGIGSLGNHRKGLTKDSALKNREYCARGLPFVIASDDDGFNKDFKYILKVEPDESPVDINRIIEFYDFIKNDNYVENMRNYAEENLTWNAVMKPVINTINAAFKK